MAALYSRLEGDDHKPLPSLPSPTLTNPDLVLPDNGFVDFTTSPTRTLRQPGFTQHETQTPPRQTERRGLMSRKMMLQRSQTDSQSGQPFSAPREDSSLPMASSPLLHDQHASKTERRGSDSSMDSDDLAAMPEFLQKYRNIDVTDDDMTEAEGVSGDMAAYDEQRRVKEEEEQVSALLSKRAEEILANAKKRLNLMEGNLRGARDLVAPLTAANLKRATSLSYTGSSPISYAHKRLDSMNYDPDPYNPSRRMLHSQASSPTMRHDFYGHVRTGSDLEIERPHTSMSRSRFPIRTPGSAGRSPDLANSPALRSSRSYDTFGMSKLMIPTNTKTHSKNSPDSSLEPVSEDDAWNHIETSYRNSSRAPEVMPPVGLGVSHLAPPSTAGSTASEDLRDQMASLKGRISSLRERAREDSMRRASATNLRSPSIFNNASDGAPELWYNQSSSQGSLPSGSPPRLGATGSRNAFAEQAQYRRDNGLPSDSSDSYSERIYNEKYRDADAHKRTPSGTAIPGTAPKQFTKHQQTSSVELPGAYPDTEGDSPGSDDYSAYDDGEADEISTEYSDDVDEDAEEESIYEEAEDPNVIPHEQRDDAFDYEHFFLHSAMGSYNAGRISPDTDVSDTSSVTSTETARAPQHQTADDTVEYYSDEDDVEDEEIPPMPGTPDALKDIEARLKHGRTVSTESMGTINTFATANEHGILSRSTSRLDIGDRAVSRSASRQDIGSATISRSTSRQDISQDRALSRSTSRQDIGQERSVSRAASRLSLSQVPEAPRPGTAMRGNDVLPAMPALADPDDSSDRADSGVGGLAHTNGRVTPKPAVANASSAVSAPSSPSSSIDPTALAFKALLDPAGKQLGERDQAILSDVIQSLRRVCVRLQEEDQYEGKVLRRRLDDARRVLDGLGVSEHDS